MNNMIDTASDLSNLITVNFSETMTPEIELTETELEAMDDIRIQDELTATVAELPVATEEQIARYNEKMTFLESIRAEIPALNVVEETTEESYAVPAGRYDYVYSMGTIWTILEKVFDPDHLTLYTLITMKKLQKEFTANYDRVGNTKFVQIKKENGVAIYERQNMDGSLRSYEVFVVKVVEKGTPLPGGNSVQETYEQYPGCAAFGKTAYDCKSIDQAEKRFDELVKKVKTSNDAKEESIKSGKPIKRGRKASVKMNVKMPLNKGSKFTISMLSTYTGVDTVYIRKAVNEWLSSGAIITSGTVKPEGGRGKPAIEYTVA